MIHLRHQFSTTHHHLDSRLSSGVHEDRVRPKKVRLRTRLSLVAPSGVPISTPYRMSDLGAYVLCNHLTGLVPSCL